MKPAVLVINAGSSSIKFALYALGQDTVHTLISGKIANIAQSPAFTAVNSNGDVLSAQEAFTFDQTSQYEDFLQWLLNWLDRHDSGHTITGVGHRVVHGGRDFLEATILTADVIATLTALIPLAPLHQAHNLAAIEAVSRWAPNMPQIACFDTSFHHTQTPLAKLFGLPRKYSEQGIIRYGFHGLSYQYIASKLPEYLSGLADGRVIVAHLGNGASMCALKQRQSVATSMGLTALDGLMMGQRCGALDAGVVLHLMQHYNMTAKEVEQLLYFESGLLGVSGISNNMQVLQASNHPHAQQAIDLFCYRAARMLSSLVSTINGLDAIVFTGGIGEHSALVRQRICEQLSWLGVHLNHSANQQSSLVISQATCAIKTLIIPTNEELVIAQSVQHLLTTDSISD